MSACYVVKLYNATNATFASLYSFHCCSVTLMKRNDTDLVLSDVKCLFTTASSSDSHSGAARRQLHMSHNALFWTWRYTLSDGNDTKYK